MSNDRLHLVCRFCADRIALFKYYPTGGFVPPANIDGADGGPLGDWLTEHLHTRDLQIPATHVPELLTEQQLSDAHAELETRRESWAAGDYPDSVVE